MYNADVNQEGKMGLDMIARWSQRPRLFASSPLLTPGPGLNSSTLTASELHTRQINLHRKMFCFGLMQIPNLYLTPFLLWVYFCSWRKFKMQVLTLMVINGLKHDVKFVNLRTKHHYWNITSVNKSFICWLPRRIKRSSNSSFKL